MIGGFMSDFLMKPKIDFAFKEIMEDENIISPMR
jgi:hypothetical protein